MILTTLTAFSLLSAPQSRDIDSYVQTSFQDAQFTVVTGAHSIPELSKINKDVAQSYRFKSSQVWIKEPFKLRMVSEVDDSQILFIVNGGRKMYKIPRSGISRTEDVSRAPGKRQTGFDFGLLTPAMLKDFFDATFVRVDRASGDVVFDLKFKPQLRDTSRYRVWIDTEKKVINKREWYAQEINNGRLMATFFYDNVQRHGNFNMATRVTVNNADDKRAGTVTFTSVKVNAGIADSLFALR